MAKEAYELASAGIYRKHYIFQIIFKCINILKSSTKT